jgi:hypothetical protein
MVYFYSCLHYCHSPAYCFLHSYVGSIRPHHCFCLFSPFYPFFVWPIRKQMYTHVLAGEVKPFVNVCRKKMLIHAATTLGCLYKPYDFVRNLITPILLNRQSYKFVHLWFLECLAWIVKFPTINNSIIFTNECNFIVRYQYCTFVQFHVHPCE